MSISRISRSAILSSAIAAMFYRQSVEGENGAVTNATAAPIEPADAAAAEQKAKDDAALKAQRLEAVRAKFDNTVDVKEVSFYFRTVTDEKTGVKTKRPTVEMPLPVPSMEGVLAILEKGGKGLDLLLEAVGQVVIDQAREYVNDNENVTAENFPYDRMTWDVIANLPKAERRGGGIPKEVWEDFQKDYVEVMPALTNKTKEQTELAAKVFVTKFANAKTNKPVLRKLQDLLGIYVENTQKGEELEPVITWLTNKLETLINTDDSKLLEAL